LSHVTANVFVSATFFNVATFIKQINNDVGLCRYCGDKNTIAVLMSDRLRRARLPYGGLSVKLATDPVEGGSSGISRLSRMTAG